MAIVRPPPWGIDANGAGVAAGAAGVLRRPVLAGPARVAAPGAAGPAAPRRPRRAPANAACAVLPDGQAAPQPPQWSRSAAGSTQAPPQQTPPAQARPSAAGAHTPAPLGAADPVRADPALAVAVPVARRAQPRVGQARPAVAVGAGHAVAVGGARRQTRPRAAAVGRARPGRRRPRSRPRRRSSPPGRRPPGPRPRPAGTPSRPRRTPPPRRTAPPPPGTRHPRAAARSRRPPRRRPAPPRRCRGGAGGTRGRTRRSCAGEDPVAVRLVGADPIAGFPAPRPRPVGDGDHHLRAARVAGVVAQGRLDGAPRRRGPAAEQARGRGAEQRPQRRAAGEPAGHRPGEVVEAPVVHGPALPRARRSAKRARDERTTTGRQRQAGKPPGRPRFFAGSRTNLPLPFHLVKLPAPPTHGPRRGGRRRMWSLRDAKDGTGSTAKAPLRRRGPRLPLAVGGASAVPRAGADQKPPDYPFTCTKLGGRSGLAMFGRHA